jgi:uncharacterized protein YdeI (YjbR/CyaY-like superfamily)
LIVFTDGIFRRGLARVPPLYRSFTGRVLQNFEIKELTKLGKMAPAGIKTFALRKEERSAIYSHERQNAKLEERYEVQLKANKKAWDFFRALAPSYRKISIHWVMSAKKEETGLRRLEVLIESSRVAK